MYIIKKRKWFIAISGLLVALSLGAVAYHGIDYGIEFTGGSVLEVSYLETPDVVDVKSSVAAAGFTDALVQPFGEMVMLLKQQI